MNHTHQYAKVRLFVISVTYWHWYIYCTYFYYSNYYSYKYMKSYIIINISHPHIRKVRGETKEVKIKSRSKWGLFKTEPWTEENSINMHNNLSLQERLVGWTFEARTHQSSDLTDKLHVTTNYVVTPCTLKSYIILVGGWKREIEPKVK